MAYENVKKLVEVSCSREISDHDADFIVSRLLDDMMNGEENDDGRVEFPRIDDLVEDLDLYNKFGRLDAASVAKRIVNERVGVELTDEGTDFFLYLLVQHVDYRGEVGVLVDELKDRDDCTQYFSSRGAETTAKRGSQRKSKKVSNA